MAFEYAKSNSNDGVLPVRDLPLNSSYAGTYGIGDVVKLNTSGEVVKAATADATVLGVLEGTNFEGLEKARKVAKVRVSGDAIYRAPYAGGTPSAASLGKTYPIDANQAINLASTAGGAYKVVDYNTEDAVVYVQIVDGTLA